MFHRLSSTSRSSRLGHRVRFQVEGLESRDLKSAGASQAPATVIPAPIIVQVPSANPALQSKAGLDGIHGKKGGATLFNFANVLPKNGDVSGYNASGDDNPEETIPYVYGELGL